MVIIVAGDSRGFTLTRVAGIVTSECVGYFSGVLEGACGGVKFGGIGPFGGS